MTIKNIGSILSKIKINIKIIILVRIEKIIHVQKFDYVRRRKREKNYKFFLVWQKFSVFNKY